jgi:pyruvate,water dikinase
MATVNEYVLELHEIDRTRVADVGGKGAHLGELTRVEGVRMPDGFCVTAGAFRRVLAGAPAVRAAADRLSRLAPDDRRAVRDLSAGVRRAIEGADVPDDVAEAVAQSLGRFEEGTAWAVRSSATAEDSPTASFAGLQDTYLNIVGPEAVLDHVRRCWASLFTERAVAYRLQNGVDHGEALMAVVVQEMVAPEASGVLFTADPVTGHRRVSVIEAVLGLGEALVSGAVNADRYTVRDGQVIEKAIALKRTAVHATAGGGTEERAVEPRRQAEPALRDAQAVELARLGRRIEAHFGSPQDVEWCLIDGGFEIVQSRPITTLFPVPEAGDKAGHVYISVGHQQMMTDPLKPLGLSFWQMTTRRPMAEAGGRLFVDVTQALASPASRAGLLGLAGRSDPLIGDALQTVLDRGDIVPSVPDEGPTWMPPGRGAAPVETDPALVTALIESGRASLATLRREIRTRTGPALLDFILEDLEELRRILFDPTSMQAIMAGIEAAWWLNDRLHEWLGETNAADTLTQSVPNNVTSEMGLALLDVADAIRPHAEVVAFLGLVRKPWRGELRPILARALCAATNSLTSSGPPSHRCYLPRPPADRAATTGRRSTASSGSSALAPLGATCPSATALGAPSTTGSAATVMTARSTAS